MLGWAVTFLIVALVAALLGFGAISGVGARSRKDVNKCVVTKETIEKHLDPTLVTEGGQELDVTDELREESA